MTLSEISKMPVGSYLVVDPTKVRMEPVGWENLIHIYYLNKHKAVRRASAFIYGICDGVTGEMPPVSQQGGMREGCGRKPLNPADRKVEVKVWVQQRTVDILGGSNAVKKMLKKFLTQRI
jgi:hypothetical protein